MTFQYFISYANTKIVWMHVQSGNEVELKNATTVIQTKPNITIPMWSQCSIYEPLKTISPMQRNLAHILFVALNYKKQTCFKIVVRNGSQSYYYCICDFTIIFPNEQ